MRIGVTGHQERPGIDWGWTDAAIRAEIVALEGPIEGWSSLAIGADQHFADTVLALGGSLVTVIPGPWYEDCFEPKALAAYRRLLGEGRAVELDGFPMGEDAYLAAGLKVADSTDMLIAIWDGAPAKGKGGTADVVAYAKGLGRHVVRLDPIAKIRLVLDT